jgi:hypothetical protein
MLLLPAGAPVQGQILKGERENGKNAQKFLPEKFQKESPPEIL